MYPVDVLNSIPADRAGVILYLKFPNPPVPNTGSTGVISLSITNDTLLVVSVVTNDGGPLTTRVNVVLLDVNTESVTTTA